MTVSTLCLFLIVSWVGLQFVIVAFPGHTYFLFKDNTLEAIIISILMSRIYILYFHIRKYILYFHTFIFSHAFLCTWSCLNFTSDINIAWYFTCSCLLSFTEECKYQTIGLISLKLAPEDVGVVATCINTQEQTILNKIQSEHN